MRKGIKDFQPNFKQQNIVQQDYFSDSQRLRSVSNLYFPVKLVKPKTTFSNNPSEPNRKHKNNYIYIKNGTLKS